MHCVRLLDGGTGRATGSLGGSLSRRLGIHNPAQDQFPKLEIKNDKKSQIASQFPHSPPEFQCSQFSCKHKVSEFAHLCFSNGWKFCCTSVLQESQGEFIVGSDCALLTNYHGSLCPWVKANIPCQQLSLLQLLWLPQIIWGQLVDHSMVNTHPIWWQYGQSAPYMMT